MQSKESHYSRVETETLPSLLETGSADGHIEFDAGYASKAGEAKSKQPGGDRGVSMSLVCVSEERVPNITTVQDVITVPGSSEQLVCGFQVMLTTETPTFG